MADGDARQRADSQKQAIDSHHSLPGRPVARLIKIGQDEQHGFRLAEAAIDRTKKGQRPQEVQGPAQMSAVSDSASCATTSAERNRAEPRTVRTASRKPQRRHHRAFEGVDRRQQAEERDHRGSKTHAEGKNSPVEAPLQRQRKRRRRASARAGLLTGLCDHHAQNRAGAGKQHRLAEELTDDGRRPHPSARQTPIS